MNNANKNPVEKLGLDIFALIGVVLIGLAFITCLIHMIIWQQTLIGFLSFFIDFLMLGAFAFVFLTARKKKEEPLLLIATLLLVVHFIIYDGGMGFSAFFTDIATVFGFVSLLLLVFLAALLVMPFLKPDALKKVAPLYTYIVGGVFAVLAVFGFIYLVFHGFKNYNFGKTIVFNFLFGFFYKAAIGFLLALPLLDMFLKKKEVKTEPVAAPPVEEAPEVVAEQPKE